MGIPTSVKSNNLLVKERAVSKKSKADISSQPVISNFYSKWG